jgi:hypothetical protein
MAVAEPAPTPSALDHTSRRFEAALDAAILGKPDYPSGTTFIPADVPVPAGTRRPYVIVHSDGRAELHRGVDRRWLLVVAVAGVVAWALSHGDA